MFKVLTESLRVLKETFPKKSVSSAYIDMISVAIDFSEAQVSDEITYMQKYKLKISPEWILKRSEELVKRHLKNQVDLFCSQPQNSQNKV